MAVVLASLVVLAMALSLTSDAGPGGEGGGADTMSGINPAPAGGGTRTAGVTLELDDDSCNGTSDPTAVRDVTITGRVVCDSSSVTPTEVTLQAVSDGEWDLSLDEDSFSFGPQGGEEEFTLTVTIPADTPAGVEDTVRVSGTAHGPHRMRCAPGTRKSR